MSDEAPPPTTERDRLAAEASRLGCLADIQPLLEILDWCEGARERAADLDALVGTRRRDLE